MCQVCQKKLNANDEVVKDYLENEVISYHVKCHIKEFGDIKETEEYLVQQNKKNYEQISGEVSNVVFLIILLITIVLGFSGIIWMVV